MFQVYPWPNVILHLDGDAFFASVIQAVNPYLKGKPLVVGKERGIATAVSYEAKKFGVKRGMRGLEIKRICPGCFFINSDYELYSLFSQKMFDILSFFSPVVEQYSVDECFADLKGLRRPLNMNYYQIGKAIKEKVESSLGITVSIGISVTKSLTKLASSFRKPSGLTVIDGLNIENFLKQIPVEKVWGIGENTTAYLKKLNIATALEFALKPESFVKKHLTKPYLEIWHELRGTKVYEINSGGKHTYKGISKTQTFHPATNNPHILWAKLLTHIEDAFKKARQLNYHVGKVSIFLKTQKFRYHSITIRLIEKTAYPLLIRNELKKGFKKIYKKGVLYRTTGCHISDLQDQQTFQPSLFFNDTLEKKAKKIYSLYETKKVDFGTTLFDKQRLIERKKPAKMKFPVLSVKL